MDIDEVRAGYDRVADEYAARLADELEHKPFDRAWLDGVGDRLATDARVVELGCGDGHIAGYLASRSLTVEGLDLSPAMIRVAQKAYPGVHFRVGNVLALPYTDDSIDALVAFYSIVNLTADDCETAFSEFTRVLAPGGLVTLAFHVGDETRRAEDWWGTGANLDFFFHPVSRVLAALTAAGLEVERVKERDPYAEPIEAQTRRAYVVAAKP